MGYILKESDINCFLSEVEQTFPNFVAGVITDEDGFSIAAKIPRNFHIHENNLALSAIAGNRDFIKDARYMQVKRDLDKSKRVKMLILLEKSNQYLNRFKELRTLIETQDLF